MRFLWVLALLGGMIHAAEIAVTSKGIEFRNPVLSQDGENIKITTVYGDKIISINDLDPVEIQAGNKIYKDYKLEKIGPEQIVIARDGITIRIKAGELNNDFRRLFGFPVQESAAPEVPADAPADNSQADEAPPVAKSAFYLAGESFREELIHARGNFTPPSSPPPVREQPRRYETQQSQANPNILRNIVFIKDEDKSAGSGFICSLWGVPVIVTNAHVFATAEKPVITDGMYNQYQPQAVLVSPNRDIAIIKIDLPSNATPLPLDYQVEKLQPGAQLTAYGNALGDEVAINANGTLRAIGPLRVEITAPIVNGHSGGPILVAGKVIGVNTSGRLVNSNVWMTDSEYETRHKTVGRKVIEKPVIRRFGTRLDTLVPNVLEVFDAEMQYHDLKFYRTLVQAANIFLLEAKEHKNPLAPEAVANRIFSSLGDFYNYRSHVKYINDLFENRIKMLDFLFATANISLNHASEQEKQNAQQMFRLINQYRKEFYDCPVCTGRGQVANPNAEVSNNLHNKYTACKDCDGQGRSHAVFYDLPRGFSPGLIPIGQGSFGGMRTGWSQAMTKNSLKNEIYWRTTDFAGVITMLEFDRNPTVNARNTEAFFVTDKLAEITLAFDYSTSLLEQLEGALSKLFGKAVHKFKNENLEKILFKKDGQTVELFWSTFINEGRITVRWYSNTLFHLKHLLVNDMGDLPHLRIKMDRNAQKNQPLESDHGVDFLRSVDRNAQKSTLPSSSPRPDNSRRTFR